MNPVYEAFQTIYEYMRPMAAPAFGIAGIIGGVIAAAIGGWRQRHRPDATPVDLANLGPRPTVTRLHADDREMLDGVRESVVNLTRAINRLRERLPGEGAA